jgi:hypothetical protein
VATWRMFHSVSMASRSASSFAGGIDSALSTSAKYASLAVRTSRLRISGQPSSRPSSPSQGRSPLHTPAVPRARAFDSGRRARQLRHRTTDLREVSRSPLVQGEPRMVADALGAVLVGEAHPRKLVEVAPRARGHEAHRDAQRPRLPVVAAVQVVVALTLQAVPGPHERAARGILAHKPGGKLHRPDARAAPRLLVVAHRRRAEGRVGVQLAQALAPSAGVEARAQPRLVQHLHPVALPEVQPADDHGVGHEIDHRPGPVGRDELTAPQLAVGLRRLRVGGPGCALRAHPTTAFRESARRSTQMCAVASTSRMDVGAAKRASSVPGAGASGSSTVNSSGLPLRSRS